MAMNDQQQPLLRPWFFKIEPGKEQRLIPRANQPIWLTDVFLVDPASAGGQGAVDACLGQGVVLASLWPERPHAKLQPAVELREEERLYVTRQGGNSSSAGALVVQFEGYLHAWYDNIDEEEEEVFSLLYPGRFLRGLHELWSSLVSSRAARNADGEVDGQAASARSAGGEEANGIDEEYEGEEEDEESDDEVDVDVQAPRASSTDGGVLALASAGRTAAIMRVAAVESQKGKGKHISVLYRCTQFSAASHGGVHQVHEGTKVHQLHFVVPPGGDTARELRRWVGASLAPLLYPRRFHKRLQRLWSGLIANATVPPHAERVEVLVDVGILCSEDRTPERVESMRTALEGMVEEPLPGSHAGMELHLLEPMRCDAGEEDCPVCLELLEGDDLAAWPGCGKPHVFHGGCLELVLRKNDRCPLCRRSWYIEPKRMLNAKHVRLRFAAKTLLGVLLFVCMVLFFGWMMHS